MSLSGACVWPKDIVTCICRQWLSPDRLVKPIHREHMTRMRHTDLHGSFFFCEPFFHKECLLFVETIVRQNDDPVPCHQLLLFEKQLWMQRSITAGKLTCYSCVVTYRRVEADAAHIVWAQTNDIDHQSCYEAGVVYTRPNGEPDIVNWAAHHCDVSVNSFSIPV